MFSWTTYTVLNFQAIRKFVFLKKVTFLECVNCVAFRPPDTTMCATASDDFSIKIWHSRKANQKRNNPTWFHVSIQADYIRILQEFFWSEFKLQLSRTTASLTFITRRARNVKHFGWTRKWFLSLLSTCWTSGAGIDEFTNILLGFAFFSQKTAFLNIHFMYLVLVLA